MLTPGRVVEDTRDMNNRAERLSAEWLSEVPPQHVLYGLKARAVAIRIDRDDVLFEIEVGEMPLRVVHPTWEKETDSRWPSTKLFRSWGPR
jgi:hypothetical protein